MFAGLLILVGSFFAEVADSIGKKQVQRSKQNVYSLGFLNSFWVTIILFVSIILGANFTFNTASFPTFLTRVVLEIVLAHITVLGIIRAERSTFAYLRLLTIPLVLIIDLVLGNSLGMAQIIGVNLVFLGLIILLYRNPKSNKGVWTVVLGAVIASITLSLFKYDITHYNSVAAEQLLVTSAVVFYFYIASVVRKQRVDLSLLIKPWTALQSLSSGLETAFVSFAFYYAPTSIITVLKRTTAMFWAVLFGHRYFKEEAMLRKVLAGILIGCGLIIILVR